MAHVKRQMEDRLPQILGGEVTLEVADLFELEYSLGSEEFAVRSSVSGADIAAFDLVVLLGDPLERAIAAAHYLKAKGVRFINTYMLAPGMGKLVQSVRLSAAGVPVPQTLCGPAGRLWDTFASRRLFDFPVILKADVSRKGNNNFLVHSREEFEQRLQTTDIGATELLAQEYVPNDGDYRILVFAGVARVAFLRQASQGSHLNNLAKGARASRVAIDELPPQLVRDVIRAAELESNEVAGVDVVMNKATGQHYVLEVNTGPKVASGALMEEKMAEFAAMIQRLLP